jgi:hypothetical protein
MTNEELINSIKSNADNFSKDELIEIIELAGKAYMDSQPFISESEVAEQTLDSLIASIAQADKDSISKAKKKISELVP